MKKKITQLIIILISIILTIKLFGDILKLLKARERIKIAQEQVLELEKEKKELEEKRKYYQSEEFIEEEARNKLNMSRPEETVVILPSGITEETEEKISSSTQKMANWRKWWNLFFK